MDARKILTWMAVGGAVYLMAVCPCPGFFECSKNKISSLLGVALMILILPPYPI